MSLSQVKDKENLSHIWANKFTFFIWNESDFFLVLKFFLLISTILSTFFHKKEFISPELLYISSSSFLFLYFFSELSFLVWVYPEWPGETFNSAFSNSTFIFPGIEEIKRKETKPSIID